MYRIAIALLIAVALATLAAVPRLAGIETWKWLLAGIGLALMYRAGRDHR